MMGVGGPSEVEVAVKFEGLWQGVGPWVCLEGHWALGREWGGSRRIMVGPGWVSWHTGRRLGIRALGKAMWCVGRRWAMGDWERLGGLRAQD